MISCPRVLHQWVRGRRPPIFVAAGAVKIPSTSRKVFVHHVAMVPLQECVHTAGPRRLVDPEFFSDLEKGL